MGWFRGNFFGPLSIYYQMQPSSSPADRPETAAPSGGAEEALRDSESVLRSFYDSISFSMGVVEMRGEEIFYVSCNPATARANGTSPEKMVGTNVTAWGVSQEWVKFWVDRYRAALLARQPVTFELSRERDGQVRWFRATVCPIVRLSKHPQFCYFSKEITDQKAAEAELRRARDAAEAANRAKSEFLANMSHEIRTPMTAILGYADTLVDEQLAPAERARAVATIRRNGEHLMGILSDILDLSRIEAGQCRISWETVSLREVVEEVAEKLRPGAVAEGIDFRVELAPETPPRIRTDSAHLRQILHNVVGNAVKFTERGSVQVRVGRAGTSLRIDIVDTGIGIALEQQAGLFQPFVQADASATRKYGGTGLGLAISQRLATLLGGTLSLVSHPGRGSTFTLLLPLGEGAGTDGAGRAQAERRGVAAAAGPLRGQVLLVDDSEDTRALVAHFLRRAGLQVTLATDGAEAIAAGESLGLQSLDLVLMDMQMPVLDGYAATRRLRELGARCPIIALTANASEEDEQRCLSAGCSAYLTKPVDREALIAVVARWLASPPPR